MLAVTFGWRAAFWIIGGLGLAWVAVWLTSMSSHIGAATGVQGGRAPPTAARVRWRDVLNDRRAWAIIGAKALSDQVWWFLLFWAPDLFHRQFHLTVGQIGAPLAVVYACAAAGSLGGGYASGRLMAMGLSLDRARKLVMLVCALAATPVIAALFVHDVWVAVGLIGLTLAAHQGFSTNLFALITDMIPADRVGSVTSLGALAGNLAGMSILALAGLSLSGRGGYPPFFAVIAVAYLLALGWIQLLVPRIRPAAPLEIITP
jgi:ACS family hexuronate transporter-like MFS transporter